MHRRNEKRRGVPGEDKAGAGMTCVKNGNYLKDTYRPPRNNRAT